MRIAFITSAFEPAKDGVGDYTRLLAQECERQGHACCLTALNDRRLENPAPGGNKQSDDSFDLVRLAADMSWSRRIGIAKARLDAFRPDWVSLQFVAFGFNSKGVVTGLGQRLRSLAPDANRHIMFHELWQGESAEDTPKQRVVGAVQRHSVLAMLKQLRPASIHTSNAFYQDVLKRRRVDADLLPLFGNLPVQKTNGDEWLFPLLRQAGMDIDASNRESFWLFGFFGALCPAETAGRLAALVRNAARRAGRKPALLSIGRSGSDETLWTKLKDAAGPEFAFLKLGEQTAEKVSQCLLSLDFGLSPNPYNLTGKSSVVAAMLEHGLPVIVLRDGIRPLRGTSEPNPDPRLIPLDESLPDRLANGIARADARSGLPETAAILLSSFARSAVIR